jgi:hypothetical protein
MLSLSESLEASVKRSSIGAIAIVAVLSLSSASAQILNNAPRRQDTSLLDLICPLTATVSPKERNPPISAEITGEMRGGGIAWLEVVYTLLDGSKVRRGDQYVDTRIWMDRSSGSIMWSGTYGRDKRKTVEGQITGDQAILYYGERHFTDGIQDSQTLIPCMKANGTGNWALSRNSPSPLTSAGDHEAIELAGNFILQAKLHNPHVFGPSETPAQLASGGAAFTTDEGVGTVKIITDETLKGLDVAAAVAAADSKDCRGKFASGRVSELVDSDVVFRGFASCEDSNGTRVTQYFIVPRPAGGFVIFSLRATGKESQPPTVTQGENLATLRKAASVSVEKK